MNWIKRWPISVQGMAVAVHGVSVWHFQPHQLCACGLFLFVAFVVVSEWTIHLGSSREERLATVSGQVYPNRFVVESAFPGGRTSRETEGILVNGVCGILDNVQATAVFAGHQKTIADQECVMVRGGFDISPCNMVGTAVDSLRHIGFLASDRSSFSSGLI